jgi:hypothetical protein
VICDEVVPSNIDLGALLREVARIRRSLLRGKHASKGPEWLVKRLFSDLDLSLRDGKLPPAHSRTELVEELTEIVIKTDHISDRDQAYRKAYKTLDDSIREIASRLDFLNDDSNAPAGHLGGGHGVLTREFGTLPERYELQISGPLHRLKTTDDDKNIRLLPGLRVLADSRKRIRKLQRLLEAWGIPLHEALSDVDLVRNLFGVSFAMGDVLIDCTFGGFRGIDSSKILVQPTIPDAPNLPWYVYTARAKMREPQPNRTKAYLSQWIPPVIDRADQVTLFTGYRDPAATTGRYDYWTTKAVVASVPRIQQGLLDGKLALQELARRLDHVLVVVTSDRKLVLARRGDTRVVDNLAGSWMASVGESIDGEKDKDRSGAPSPILAVSRCLLDYDELNLEQSDLDGARVTYLGLATEWAFMYVNLLVLVELAVDSDRVLDRAVPGEHRAFAITDFAPDACLPLVRSGSFQTARFHQANPIVPASRVALLLSLFARFGADAIRRRIETEVHGA